jgi:hypothetical protein
MLGGMAFQDPASVSVDALTLNGNLGLSGANYGTSGQVLTSQGSGSAPQWATPSGGKILQVIQSTKTDTATTTSTSFVDISDLSASITPVSASNKILIFVQLGSVGNPSKTVLFNIVRNTTNLAQPDSGINPASLNQFPGTTTAALGGATIIWVDSPATTSSTTYKVQWRVDGNTGYLNRHIASTNFNSISTITVMEVAA